MGRNTHYFDNAYTRKKKAKQHTEEMALKYQKEIEECVRNTKVYDDNTVVNNAPREYNQAFTKERVLTADDTVSALFKFAEPGKRAARHRAHLPTG